MNAKSISITCRGALLGVMALAACSGPQEEDLKIVPLTMYRTAAAGAVEPGVDYTEVHDEWMDADVMKKATPRNIRVVISRSSQRGTLMVGNEVGMDFPVCTGMSGHTTPLGRFHITQKSVHHVSNLYDASMPYFMRLTDSGIGMHVGPVFREPQSHGCIRMTRSSCVPLFNTVRLGTPVAVVP